MKRTAASSKKELQSIEAMSASEGWNLTKSIMREELLAAAIDLSSKMVMDKSELDFRRGMIYAANALINLPERMKNKLSADIAILEFEELKSKHDK
jgi:selenophosphate synthase